MNESDTVLGIATGPQAVGSAAAGAQEPAGTPAGPGAAELAAAALDLARRFAAGATMWCVSPRWPAHGRHVAVEFVHPVVVGKRALPAVSVEARELVTTLRLLARPGDILLAIGDAGDAVLRSLLRRCAAWGLGTVWIGAGEHPGAGLADHVLWAGGEEMAVAARSGDVVLRYHLLWELAHVVFEHPGLLAPDAACEGEACITCSDEGRIAEVAALSDGGEAEVISAGRRELVDATLVEPVRPGDLVLVHAGVAIALLEGASS